MVERSLELLGALRDHEIAIADLYRAFAGAYPGHAAVWTDLSEQEVRHAVMLQGLADVVEEAGLRLDPGRFHADAVRTSVQYVRELTDLAASGRLSLLDAAAAAFDLESALLESRIFELFANVPEAGRLAERMKADISAHVASVRWVLEKSRAAA